MDPKFRVYNFLLFYISEIALEIMKNQTVNIEILDLHSLVTDHCGLNYTKCDWCRVEPCSYHYNYLGEGAQGLDVAAKIRQVLA